jgi:hypothetical protein
MAVFPVPGGPARRHARPAIFLLLIMSTTIPAACKGILLLTTEKYYFNQFAGYSSIHVKMAQKFGPLLKNSFPKLQIHDN